MKRITLLAGHYGSGKTNIAVNMALDEAAGSGWQTEDRSLSGNGKAGKRFDRLAVADLDIVNPYFRTEDSREDLEKAGIRMICSIYANSNVDLPSMPEDLYAITDDRELRTIIDVGGDDRGALALGRLSEAIRAEADYEMFMVINCCRPLTRDAASTLEVMREIELAGRLPFTGLINNSNLGRDTSPEDVLESLGYAREVERLSGLPLCHTTVDQNIFRELDRRNRELPEKDRLPGLKGLKLQKRPV